MGLIACENACFALIVINNANGKIDTHCVFYRQRGGITQTSGQTSQRRNKTEKASYTFSSNFQRPQDMYKKDTYRNGLHKVKL